MNMIVQWSQTAFLPAIWARSVVRDPRIQGAIFVLSLPYRQRLAVWRDHFELVEMGLHWFNLCDVHRHQYLCTPTALATSKKQGRYPRPHRRFSDSQNDGNKKYDFQSLISHHAENTSNYSNQGNNRDPGD